MWAWCSKGINVIAFLNFDGFRLNKKYLIEVGNTQLSKFKSDGHHSSKLLSNGSGKTALWLLQSGKYINLLKIIKMDLRVTDTETTEDIQHTYNRNLIGKKQYN